MKKLSILGLLIAFACIDSENHHPHQDCHKKMTVSDASPVQFWPVGCETWNESRPKGVHHYCFCQPWECDDEIKIPFKSSEQAEVERIVSSFNSDLSNWFNTNNGVTPATGGSRPDWAWSSDFSGSAKVTTVNTFGPKGIRLSTISIPDNAFVLRIKYAITATPNTTGLRLKLIIRDASNNQLLNQEFGVSATGLEQTQDFTISSQSIIDNADHFWIIPTSDGDLWSAGDDLHITEMSYIYNSPLEYSLKAYDEDDIELFDIPFQSIGGDNFQASFVPSDYDICDQQIVLKIFGSSGKKIELDPLDEWYNVIVDPPIGDPVPWETGPAPRVLSGITVTNELTGSVRVFGSNPYTFSYDITCISTGTNHLVLRTYNDDLELSEDIIDIVNGSNVGTIEILDGLPPALPNKISLQMEVFESDFDVTVNAFEPADPGVSETEFFRSDCLKIAESHNESLLIDYSNHRNYAGIDYGTLTPDPSFSIRIPAIFFETRFPQEGEDIQLSNNQIIALNSQVKEQRLLSTDRMPIYMHRKMVEVLSHQFLYIDGEYWEKGGENYDKKEKNNKRDPFDMYSCWLTRQNFVVRNIL